MAGGRRHAVFKRFNKFRVRHLRFFIAGVPQFLLHCKTLSLINRIIELAITLPQFRTGDYKMEPFRNFWIFSRHFCERRNNLRLIDKNRRTPDMFAAMLPERVDNIRRGTYTYLCNRCRPNMLRIAYSPASARRTYLRCGKCARSQKFSRAPRPKAVFAITPPPKYEDTNRDQERYDEF